jgi:hypothetical protein
VERFIALEMSRIELESNHTDMEKQFDGPKLEVHRINRFLERENLANEQGRSGILSNAEEDDACRRETCNREGDSGQAPARGTL